MFSDWEKGDANCQESPRPVASADRYATKVQVKIVPKTPGLSSSITDPIPIAQQDEYSYSSKFSLGGKVTAGYDDKGPKAGVELSGGAEFSRSTKVTIKDATLVGISNPATEIAGWRFDMPRMRAVNDLTPYGGPSMSCDNLLQMPYPVQQGAMESRQFAIFRLPAAQRGRLKGIDIAVSLSLEESSSRLQNWDDSLLQCLQLQLHARKAGCTRPTSSTTRSSPSRSPPIRDSVHFRRRRSSLRLQSMHYCENPAPFASSDRPWGDPSIVVIGYFDGETDGTRSAAFAINHSALRWSTGTNSRTNESSLRHD